MICCGRINGFTFALTVCCLLWWKALVFWSGSWFRFPEFAWKRERVGGEGGDISRYTLWSICGVLSKSYCQIFLHETESTGHLNNMLYRRSWPIPFFKKKKNYWKSGCFIFSLHGLNLTAACSSSGTREHRTETTWNFNNEWDKPCFFLPLSRWWVGDN